MRLAPRHLLLALASLSLAAGCANTDDAGPKGVESAVPAPDAKSDDFRSPTLHGELGFRGDATATFDADHLYHAWDFTLTDSAALTLTADPVDKNVDTVMYLYGRAAETESWGAYQARNDDYDGTVGSQITGDFEAGQYRVLIKGYKAALRGTFSLTAACAGAGCPAPPAVEFLSADEAQAIVDGLDSICGDTFCGGDLNYTMASASCDGATGTCDLRVDARSYYEEDYYAADVLDGVDLSTLTRSGALGTDGTFVGSVIEAIDKGEDGIWVRASCALTHDYRALSDVLEPGYSGSLGITDKIYDDFIECLFAMESVLYGL